MTIRPTFSVLTIFLIAFTCQQLFAQIDTGSISGRITDDSGAVIPGASVTVTHRDTARVREAVSNDQGEFNMPALPIGTYDVEVTMPGFKRFSQEGIQLEINRTARLNV